MKKACIALVVLAACVSSAGAWNDKGHMVVARLAWKKLSVEERAKIVKLLEKHPHYEEFLKANKPENMTQDEWVFLRAATWADWVRNGPPERKKFSVPDAHFVDFPFVQAESKVLAAQALRRQRHQQNQGIQAQSGRRRKWGRCRRRHYLAVPSGGRHSPAAALRHLLRRQFPRRGQGGQSLPARLSGRVIQLHFFWDGLLGKPTSLSSITNTVLEIEALVKDHPEAVKGDLETNKTPESWAKESFATAKKVGYAGGKLNPANNDDHPVGEGIPEAPADYAETAGDTARFCAAKGGERLAQVLREVAKKN